MQVAHGLAFIVRSLAALNYSDCTTWEAA
jgi:hypothetical protein